jgi:serine/threonine-protein kinase
MDSNGPPPSIPGTPVQTPLPSPPADSQSSTLPPSFSGMPSPPIGAVVPQVSPPPMPVPTKPIVPQVPAGQGVEPLFSTTPSPTQENVIVSPDLSNIQPPTAAPFPTFPAQAPVPNSSPAGNGPAQSGNPPPALPNPVPPFVVPG